VDCRLPKEWHIDLQFRKAKEKKGRFSMSNDNKRVLNRIGAHELTKQQTEEVAAGLSTLLSVILTTFVLPNDHRLDS
jgi:hypothetical protein